MTHGELSPDMTVLEHQVLLGQTSSHTSPSTLPCFTLYQPHVDPLCVCVHHKDGISLLPYFCTEEKSDFNMNLFLGPHTLGAVRCIHWKNFSVRWKKNESYLSHCKRLERIPGVYYLHYHDSFTILTYIISSAGVVMHM